MRKNEPKERMKTSEAKDQFEQHAAKGTWKYLLEFPKRALSALSECEDIMPRGLCSDLGMLQGSTYKEGVDAIRRWQRAERKLEAEAQTAQL